MNTCLLSAGRQTAKSNRKLLSNSKLPGVTQPNAFASQAAGHDAYTLDMILRNFPPIDPFVVRWEWPLFVRADGLDPTKLKQMGGRPTEYEPAAVLNILGRQRLSGAEWLRQAKKKIGIGKTCFYDLLAQLEEDGQIQQSENDEKWSQSWSKKVGGQEL